MNLKLRLNLVTTSLLLLLMLVGIALNIYNAKKNALAEIASAEKSTLYLFDGVIMANANANHQTIDLSVFRLQQLSHMRHLKIELVDHNNRVIDSNQVFGYDTLNNKAPVWFERLLNSIMPHLQPKVKNLFANHQLVAKLIITPDPTYEYAEIWKQIIDLLLLLAVFFICVNLMIAWVITQALKPTATILLALDKIEQGQLQTRLPHFKFPELSRIGEKFNHMIETLQKSISQNHQLTNQLLTLQEAERKSIARDLHDEFGQCLTAIHTDASVVLKHAKTKYPELQASALAITQLSRHLMDLVSGLLQRLRPGVLDELGLLVALQDLVDHWQMRERKATVNLKVNQTLSKEMLGEAESLVVYRLVQESLTNVSRHAAATVVSITLDLQIKNQHQGMSIKVHDNGIGFKGVQTEGFGLPGMRERVEGLGGQFSIETSTKLGTSIIAWIPLNPNVN